MPKELDVKKIELEKYTLVDAFLERETLAQFGELLEKFAALNIRRKGTKLKDDAFWMYIQLYTYICDQRVRFAPIIGATQSDDPKAKEYAEYHIRTGDLAEIVYMQENMPPPTTLQKTLKQLKKFAAKLKSLVYQPEETRMSAELCLGVMQEVSKLVQLNSVSHFGDCPFEICLLDFAAPEDTTSGAASSMQEFFCDDRIEHSVCWLYPSFKEKNWQVASVYSQIAHHLLCSVPADYVFDMTEQEIIAGLGMSVAKLEERELDQETIIEHAMGIGMMLSGKYADMLLSNINPLSKPICENWKQFASVYAGEASAILRSREEINE